MPKDYANRSSHYKRGAKSRTQKTRHKKPVTKRQGQATPRSNKKTKSQQASRQLPWRLIILLVVVLLVTFGLFAFLKWNAQDQLTGDENQQSGPQVVTATPVKTVSSDQQTTPVEFKFQSTASATTGSLQDKNYLQLGTYAQGDDALQGLLHKLKANNLSFQQVKVAHLGQVYYRVQMGPYQDKKKADALQAKLQEKNIYSVVISK